VTRRERSFLCEGVAFDCQVSIIYLIVISSIQLLVQLVLQRRNQISVPLNLALQPHDPVIIVSFGRCTLQLVRLEALVLYMFSAEAKCDDERDDVVEYVRVCSVTLLDNWGEIRGD
jgi:hypothetical protein